MERHCGPVDMMPNFLVCPGRGLGCEEEVGVGEGQVGEEESNCRATLMLASKMPITGMLCTGSFSSFWAWR